MKLQKLLKKSVKAARNGKPIKHTTPTDLPAGAKLDREGNLVLPKHPGDCVDLLYQLREGRLALQRQCEKFEKAEAKLRDWFIDTLPKSSASGMAGKIARVQIETKVVPQASNWQAVHAYIAKHNAFELLQRRLNDSAVKERWDEGEVVPGVEAFVAKKVSCTKL